MIFGCFCSFFCDFAYLISYLVGRDFVIIYFCNLFVFFVILPLLFSGDLLFVICVIGKVGEILFASLYTNLFPVSFSHFFR